MLRAIWALVALLFMSAPAHAEPFRTPHVEIELHSTRATVAPGERFTILLRQKMIPNWHTYWVNPADSGEPTTLAWTVPEGFSVGTMQWPAPEIYRLGPIVNYVLYNEQLYPIEVTAPADLKIGEKITLSAKAAWLVCEDICIPEEGQVSLSLRAAAASEDDPVWAQRAREAIAALPIDAAAADARGEFAERFTLTVPGGEATRLSRAIAEQALRDIHYFPYNQSLIDHAAEQEVAVTGGALTLSTALSLSHDGQTDIGGVIVAEERAADGQWRPVAFALAPPPRVEPVEPSAPPPMPVSDMSALVLLGVLASAFVGGLILNVMPCVFPVLSIKALSLAGGAHGGEARKHGVAFFLGVMTTFMLLAGGLLALKAAGAAAGWGFQLQEPAVVSALSLLFFLIGLNLLGVFEFGGGLQNVGGGLAMQSGAVGAFFTGLLAVIAATPCTAPFMAYALGWAATAPAAASLAVFAALGVGFATPFTLLSFAPGLQKALPKPGPWMERFKQFLAFPMFATVVWLVWVLTRQTGGDGAAAILAAFVGVGFVLWAWRQGNVWRIVGLLAVLTVAALVWRPLTTAAAPTEAVQTDQGVWTAQRVADLTAAGKPVFVNFTADWCVTCKANEAVALSSERIKAAFAERGIVYLKGDWTRRDPAIAAELAAHGRAGVPLYLYYAPGAAQPVVLPQLLTEGIVLRTISEASGDQTP